MKRPRPNRRPPALAFALALALAPAGAPPALAALAAPSATVQRVNGVPCVGANDLARLIDGVQYENAVLRKLVVRTHGHLLTFTADTPIALVDDRTVNLDAPVRSLGGEFMVPVSLLAYLPADSNLARLGYDAAASRLRLAPAGGWVGWPRVVVTAEGTQLVFAAERAGEADVVTRTRAHLRVRVPGTFAERAPDSLPAGSLVRAERAGGVGGSVVFEFSVAPEAAGFREQRAQGRAFTLVLARGGADLEPFASDAPPGPRAMRVVVLDPGHGGADTGVTVAGTSEKDLALSLARMLAVELERRGVRVVLTRDSDRSASQNERAETANRARPDVVLSLHFDGFPSPRARGATAWCAPATAEEGVGDARAEGQAPMALLPWRDVALAHAAAGRALADALTGALENRGLGPVRVREQLPVALLGVHAPGVMLECATLTSPDDIARVSVPDGLHELALAITEGLAAWQRHEAP